MTSDAAISLAYALAASPRRPGPDVAALAARMRLRIRSRQEAQFRALLGRWVSECEPAAAFDQSGRLLGLSHASIIHIGIDLGEEQ